MSTVHRDFSGFCRLLFLGEFRQYEEYPLEKAPGSEDVTVLSDTSAYQESL